MQGLIIGLYNYTRVLWQIEGSIIGFYDYTRVLWQM
jgi:hypothetical protein